MRLDDYLSTVGVVKRRTLAKELAQNGMVMVGGRAVKPSYQVKINDIVQIKGKHALAVEILQIPSGSVPKAERDNYFRRLPVI
ncbi:MAG: RNA-binding S4 domain-containing protein [Candidatus Zixiibacteriota bacterium]|nr:MAG: RNA-binding S4 domain-containing protein [candidate division Zixibacteria bacterium]